MCNLLAQVPKGAQPVVAALVRTIFAQPEQAVARTQLRRVVQTLEKRYPKVAALLHEAEEDVLAHISFPECAPAASALHERTGEASQGNRERGGHLP